MKISIREVAKVAGVSVGTVSHVLNGNANARISEATQKRVRSAAAQLGYRPNHLARSLWRGKTETIGVLVSGLRNPFFVEVLEAAQQGVVAAGYQVLLDAGPSVRGTYLSHPPVRNWPVDAALAWTNPDQVITTFVGASGDLLPTVYLGYERADNSDWVAFDLRGGARQLLGHLHDRGYRRVAYVSAYAAQKAAKEERNQTYLEACDRHGWTPTHFATEDEEETRAAGAAVGAQIAGMPHSDRPDAVVCHNDILAIGVLAGLLRAGVRVPEEVAVTGFDGIEESQCAFLPLTTVRTDPVALVSAALEILFDRVRNGPSEAARTLTIPAELWVGATT